MRTVIVGGVAGGMSAAARLRRLQEDAEIIVLERGPYVSFANCGLPYYVGAEIERREALLLQTPERLRARFALDVRVQHEVLRIDRVNQEVEVRVQPGGTIERIHYDALVLSPGASPVRPPIPGINHERILTIRTIPDVDRVVALVQSGARRAAVVGGGSIGVEMAEALVHRGVHVTMIEQARHVLPFLDGDFAALAEAELRDNGVDVRVGVAVAGFEAVDGGGVRVRAGSDAIDVDFVVLAIGVSPEVTLARDAGLALGEVGGIRVDEQLRTSDPNIYAVGDAVEVVHRATGTTARIPLAGSANRMGRIVADVLSGVPSTFHGAWATAIVRVFGLTAAATGASSAWLERRGVAFHAAVVHAGHHAGYFPGAETLHLKLLYTADGLVKGAQAIGRAGVDKRIDVVATALEHGAHVEDVARYDLAYAPPYGAAKDPLHMVAFVADNDLSGRSPLVRAEQVAQGVADGAVLLDVRTPAEVAADPVIGALAIPLDELRARLQELPRDRELLVMCAVGQRGHTAQRILRQRGFRTRNVSGGRTSLRAVA